MRGLRPALTGGQGEPELDEVPVAPGLQAEQGLDGTSSTPRLQPRGQALAVFNAADAVLSASAAGGW